MDIPVVTRERFTDHCMTTNTPKHPFFRPNAVTAASAPTFMGTIVLAQPVPMRVAACVAGGITLALALLLTCGHYTRKVRVTGQLIPAAGSIKVVAPAFGRITRRMVEDGARVAAGQALFELTAERASGSGAVDTRIDGLLNVRRDEREQTRQLQIEELKRRARALDERRASIETEIATRGQEIALQDVQVHHSRDKLQRYAKLAKRGFVSHAQLDDVSAEVAAQQARRKALEGSLLSIRRELLDVQEEARGIDGKVALIASQAKQDVALVEQEAAEHEGRSRVLVTAPIAGTVTAQVPDTGQTVAGGVPLATVLPVGSQLEARLMVPSRAIAFVDVGQQVLLRIDAFPYQKFGQVPATVARVEQAPASEGDAAAGPLYRVTVRLKTQAINADGHDKPFKAGMTLEADILQDRRRLIEWLYEPLVRRQKGARDEHRAIVVCFINGGCVEVLDESAGRMVSGGLTIAMDSGLDWDVVGGGEWGGGGGASIYDGTSGGGAWESGWGEWDRPNAPSEGHLAFDNALAGAAGVRTGIAVEAFAAGLLTAAEFSWAGPVAAAAGLAAGGYVYYKAQGALKH